MTSSWRSLAPLLVMFGLLAAPSVAFADTSVIVLGMRSSGSRRSKATTSSRAT